ncbi:MAG TPA: ABC transporter ATP-binding protein [Gemmatimonadales bacterium]|nr:ABC transporter ATP-binding protein [Gemmatimonadales bacterium]
MSGPLLRVETLTAGYQEISVLEELSFDLPAGLITAVIGPNGAGKSTLLRTIYGLTRVYGGRLLYDEEDITRLPPVGRLARGIVLVAQGRNNFPAMTVTENLLMATYTRRDPEVRADLDAVLDRFPLLKKHRRQMAGNLSGGEQQILEMAMGLLLRPRLLLVDEPSLGLAPLMMDYIFEAIRQIGRAGTTVLMVEQNAAKALAISDRALVLDLGRRRLEGPAAEIAADPQVRRLYLGDVS